MPSSSPSQRRELWLENALLSEIVALHPDRLTADELAVRMEEARSNTDRVAIEDALQALKRSGLVRLGEEVVEPTYAALRAAEIFGL
jgi:Fe2+ or Zn2+ uptake regulation protein